MANYNFSGVFDFAKKNGSLFSEDQWKSKKFYFNVKKLLSWERVKVLCSRLLEIQREIDSPKSRHNKSGNISSISPFPNISSVVLNLLLLLLEPNFKVRISASHALHHNFFNKAYSQKAPQKHCIKIYPVLSTTPPNMAALKEYNCKLHHKCSIFETEASDSDMNRNKSLLSTRASEELSTSSSPQRKSYKSLRTSLFKSMKQVQETESQINPLSWILSFLHHLFFFQTHSFINIQRLPIFISKE